MLAGEHLADANEAADLMAAGLTLVHFLA